MSSDLNRAFGLEGRTALITGGGTGLGLAMARCFATAGAKVVLVGRREAELAKACKLIGERAVAVSGDVTCLTAVPELVDRAESKVGPINVLINNAGVHLKKPAVDTTDTEFAQVVGTHVFGAFALTREAGRRMVARHAGTILFTASMTALIGMPQVVAYSAAKAAYAGMVRALATEWGPSGVRVNAIAPGWIASAMLEQALWGDPARRARILARTPMNRFGEPDDIGWTAVYLASRAGQFVNGVVLPVDGGAAIGF